ncbi:excinuclease ABC, C subunit [Lysobacter enzymogenes]|uniref:Excinuclease ABC, C subunit n=1 Tax=Lysobacter enzymogenes TaxID=69 RepID=A0A0S2DHL6_LYSEN|nr:GIY-YIG nuclease family protein [Lysobacter enzymogenes]ALN58076.1 excinuclease ABC, C subunit [Lysobacter enzymogenes]QCW26551.1 GIY-YIG nuclease family protein [Lysobacter enzymogenes]
MDANPNPLRLSARQRGTLYAGVTSDPIQRIWQHRNDLTEGFTRRHGVHVLVWYELHPDMLSAIIREKRIKSWKLELIESANPQWRDLYSAIIGASAAPAS